MSVAAFADTYTVAGSSTDVFETAWDPSNTTNDLVLTEGTIYRFVKNDVELPAGTVSFKVCANHSWDVAYPASNYNLSISSSGIYDITITFDAGESKSVNATAEKKGEADVLPSIMMHGNFSGNWNDTEAFTIADDKNTASFTLALTKDNYSFGMRIGGTGNWTSNGSAFTRENNSFAITSGDGNLTLDADASGNYTFTWTFANNTLTITYPAPTDEPEPETFYYLVGSVKGWVAADINKFATTEVEDEYKLNTTLTEGEGLKVLGVKGNTQTWYPEGTGNEYVVDAAHAGEVNIYFRPAGNADWADFGGFFYIEVNSTDGIENIINEAQTLKIMKDGMLLIQHNGEIYTLTGNVVR